MIIFPAVDIKDGSCVRLRKGKPETAEEYFAQPWRAALRWEQSGAEWLHVIDLDGALTRSQTNRNAVETLLEKTVINIQFGGGIRSEEDVDWALEAGVKHVVLGTRAITDPQWALRLCRSLPKRVVIALDAEDGLVKTEGWQQSSGIDVTELAKTLQDGEPAAFLYTDVERDGMMSHPNFEGVEELLRNTEVPIIASGGVSCLEDIEQLGSCGADGVITGKALYEHSFTLEEALETADRFGSRLG